MKCPTSFVLLLVLAAPGAAQAAQPYAGMQHRAIKAMSQDKVEDLRAGRGAGYALAAELNGYPGPAHVLELRDGLGLSEAQQQRVEALLADMRRQAIPLGERLIEREGDLDRLFASHAVTPERLAAATQAIGATEAALRATHLKFHLATLEILTPAQIEQYSELRGYAGSPHHLQHMH